MFFLHIWKKEEIGGARSGVYDAWGNNLRQREFDFTMVLKSYMGWFVILLYSERGIFSLVQASF